MLLSILFPGLSLALCAALILVWRSRTVVIQQLSETRQQCAKVQKELAQSTLKIDELKAQLAHDLRGPLQSVVGYSDLLAAEATGPLNPKQRKFLENIRATTPKILDIINRDQA